jgi:hypothetical protein
MSGLNTQITTTNLVERLREAVPEFQPDPDDVHDRLNYLVLNALMTGFVPELDLSTDQEKLKRIFEFIESAARSQDQSTVDIIRDALWGLATYADVEQYRPLMGRRSLQLLKQAVKR